MRKTTDRNRIMTDISRAIEMTRSMATLLVEQESRRTGKKKMPAQDAVAAAVGASASWLRKFMGRNPEAALSFGVGLSIWAAYERMCERIEAAQETERARLDALRREMDAVVPGYFGMVDRMAPPAPGAANGEAPSQSGDAQT